MFKYCQSAPVNTPFLLNPYLRVCFHYNFNKSNSKTTHWNSDFNASKFIEKLPENFFKKQGLPFEKKRLYHYILKVTIKKKKKCMKNKPDGVPRKWVRIFTFKKIIKIIIIKNEPHYVYVFYFSANQTLFPGPVVIAKSGPDRNRKFTSRYRRRSVIFGPDLGHNAAQSSRFTDCGSDA